MYDTINFSLEINEEEFFKIKNSLNFSKEEYNNETNILTLKGKIENYNVFLKQDRIILNGSLCKFWLANNIETLTKQQTAEAIQCLSDTLLLPIHKAKINRLDFAQNIITDYKPTTYYEYLGNCQYYNRFVQKSSIYYQNTLRKIIFYDKIEELKNKKLIIPKEWKDKNVLRYENRFTKNVTKEFRLSEPLTMKNLTDTNFCKKVLQKWTQNYKAINKTNKTIIDMNKVKTEKDFEEALLAKCYSQIEFDKQVEKARKLNIFPNKEYYSRSKAKHKKRLKKHSFVVSQQLIELDDKIEEAKKYAIEVLGF